MDEPDTTDSSEGDCIMAVLDFEATCAGDMSKFSPQEIIEFPVVLINASKKSVIGVFHSYCKPVIHPKLTLFCTHLTGVTQAQRERSRVGSVEIKRKRGTNQGPNRHK